MIKYIRKDITIVIFFLVYKHLQKYSTPIKTTAKREKK